MSHASAMLRSPIRLRYDDEDDDASHVCDVDRMSCDVLSPDIQPQDTKRSSFVAHSRNGGTTYRSSEKTRDSVSPITANETCIWSPVYPRGKKKCCARIVRTTRVLNKKLPCRFRIRDETHAHYPALNFQRQTCRVVLPEERIRREDEESSFVESCVWKWRFANSTQAKL